MKIFTYVEKRIDRTSSEVLSTRYRAHPSLSTFLSLGESTHSYPDMESIKKGLRTLAYKGVELVTDRLPWYMRRREKLKEGDRIVVVERVPVHLAI
jgi:hypothetical protein